MEAQTNDQVSGSTVATPLNGYMYLAPHGAEGSRPRAPPPYLTLGAQPRDMLGGKRSRRALSSPFKRFTTLCKPQFRRPNLMSPFLQVLQRLQEGLEALQLNGGLNGSALIFMQRFRPAKAPAPAFAATSPR